MRKIVLGVTVIIAAFSYKKVIYACEESQLIKEKCRGIVTDRRDTSAT